MSRLQIFGADVGSVAAGRFGWASLDTNSGKVDASTEIDALANAVAERLRSGDPVALGFECPLYVPLAADPMRLTSARQGEGNRAWCAGAGAGALATGLAQVPWILRAVRMRTAVPTPAFVRWREFIEAGTGLFLWEAFVTAGAKRDSHANDAVAAVEKFATCLPDVERFHALSDGDVMSLLGAAMLRTGWTSDPAILSLPTLVIRA